MLLHVQKKGLILRKLLLLPLVTIFSAGLAFAESTSPNALDNWVNQSASMYFKQQAACTDSMPKLTAPGGGVSWHVSVAQCGGAAAIVTTGRFSTFYSWVARNGGGADRIPNQNCEVNSCSVAKVQRTYTGVLGKLKVRVWCLGTSGRSALGQTFRRITGKQPAVTRDPARDIVRYCIKPGVNKN